MEFLGHKLALSVMIASVTVAASLASAAPGKSKGAGGWEPSADHMESVVIAIKTFPEEADADPELFEPACVALQIGINLLMDNVPGQAGSVPVTPADEVILFPTLNGVEIVNPANGVPLPPDDPDFDPDAPLNRLVCNTPAGPATRSLNQLLGGFVALGGQVVSCPLCAEARGIDDPNFGYIGTGVDVHELFLYGDKVIDF